MTMIARHRNAFVCAAAFAGLLGLPGGARAERPATGGAMVTARVVPVDAAPGDDQDSARFSRTIKVGRNSSLTISNISGNITVTGGPGDEMRIEGLKRSGGGDERNAVDIDVAEHAGRVEVRTQYRGGSNHASVDYTVTVPTDAAVYLRSVSGNVRVSRVQGETRAESISGNVAVDGVTHLDKASSVSGNVEIADGAADGDLSTGSVSGRVTIHGLKAQGLDVSSVSGDLTLTGITCPRVGARTVSGTFTFDGTLEKNGRYEISSHSGDIRLRLNGSTGFELNASSFSGDVDSDYPIVIHDTGGDRGRSRQRHAIHGTFGDASALLTIRTFSGNISLQRH
jgi:DUF4097 and DUF4098 domain-containing protein YvlB